jgi:hypothetical protein
MLEIEDPAAAIDEPHVVRAGVTVDQALVTRFVQQQTKLVDLGSGGHGGWQGGHHRILAGQARGPRRINPDGADGGRQGRAAR